MKLCESNLDEDEANLSKTNFQTLAIEAEKVMRGNGLERGSER